MIVEKSAPLKNCLTTKCVVDMKFCSEFFLFPDIAAAFQLADIQSEMS